MFRKTLAVVALAGMCSFAAAQPALKVVTVDMNRLLKDYYKSAEATTKLQEAGRKAEEQIEQMNKQGKELIEQFKEMEEQSKSLLLSAEARNKAAEDAKAKFEEIQRKDADVKGFAANTQRALQQRTATTIQLLLEEIQKVAVDVAKKRGATMLLDSSGPTQLGIPPILFSDASYDITEEVLKEINKDAPPPAPAAATKP
ncbi:MAG TPA: OmpH family outer membrane protein [Opitutaceae bacterium]